MCEVSQPWLQQVSSRGGSDAEKRILPLLCLHGACVWCWCLQFPGQCARICLQNFCALDVPHHRKLCQHAKPESFEKWNQEVMVSILEVFACEQNTPEKNTSAHCQSSSCLISSKTRNSAEVIVGHPREEKSFWKTIERRWRLLWSHRQKRFWRRTLLVCESIKFSLATRVGKKTVSLALAPNDWPSFRASSTSDLTLVSEHSSVGFRRSGRSERRCSSTATRVCASTTCSCTRTSWIRRARRSARATSRTCETTGSCSRPRTRRWGWVESRGWVEMGWDCGIQGTEEEGRAWAGMGQLLSIWKRKSCSECTCVLRFVCRSRRTERRSTSSARSRGRRWRPAQNSSSWRRKSRCPRYASLELNPSRM